MSKSLPITDCVNHEPRTVKEIAAIADLSESRVRVLLNAEVKRGVVTKAVNTVGPAVFFIDIDDTPHDLPDTPPEAPETPNYDEAPYEPAGKPGTFLGDAAVRNTETGEVVNKLTGVRIPAAEKAQEVRKVLNPQPVINAKTEALRAAGGNLAYDRNERRWIVEDSDGILAEVLTAKELSERSADDLVAIITDEA